MAAIDFPASPTNGQVFAAPNGVTYIWSSTYTAWQAQPMSAGFVGDFFARNGASTPNLAAGLQVLKPDVVVTGNAGSWYNPANGRYTPPKGRYYIFGALTGVNGSSQVGIEVFLYKNGVQQTDQLNVAVAATLAASATGFGVFDASGTDYFELQANPSQLAAVSAGRMLFGAIPISPNANMVQGTGDFCATGTPSLAVNAWTTIVPTTIASGNAGGWYNTSNGRYTPPAGRYRIFATYAGLSTAAAANFVIRIAKNGVQMSFGQDTSATTNYNAQPVTEVTLDANGTDYFECQGYANAASQSIAGMTFSAFPLSGIKGPQGDQGGNTFTKLLRFNRVQTDPNGTVSYTGVGFKPSAIIFMGGGSGTVNMLYCGISDSSLAGASVWDGSANVPQINNSNAITVGINGNFTVGNVLSYDADGFTIQWTKTGAPGGTMTMNALCFR